MFEKNCPQIEIKQRIRSVKSNFIQCKSIMKIWVSKKWKISSDPLNSGSGKSRVYCTLYDKVITDWVITQLPHGLSR